MSLPLPVVERLFERLIATYGNEFANNWATSNTANTKSMWAHELSGFEKNLGAIAYALENLPERAPNLIAFRNLCRLAPSAEPLRIESPKADPEIVKMVVAKLSAPVPKVDPKAWAHRILADVAAGMKKSPTVVQMAKNALKEVA